MSYKILFFAFRKPDTSPDQFRTQFEQQMDKIKEITGPSFPLTHVRRYIHRSSDAPYPATVLSGTQADVEYDVISEMTFENEAGFQAFYTILQEPANAKWMEDNGKGFLDQGKQPVYVVLGDITSQSR